MGLDYIDAAVNNVTTARNMCSAGTEDYEAINERLSELQSRKSMWVSWNNTVESIKRYCDDGLFQQAENALNYHYKNFENNLLDFYYWEYMFNIWHIAALELEDSSLIDVTKLETYYQQMTYCAGGDNNYSVNLEEKRADLNSLRRAKNYGIAKKNAEESAANHYYDKAIEIMDDYYRMNAEEKKFSYWCGDFCRYHRLKAGYLMDCDKDPSNSLVQLDMGFAKLRAMPMSSDERETLEMALQAHKLLVERYQVFKMRQNTPKPAATNVATPTPSAPKPASVDNTNNEKEYLVELKECYADGVVTDKERRLLNRLRISLGISEERAAQLEASINSPSLNDDEKEYFEEVKACLEDDGVITDKERRLLNKIRASLGISEERAKEIEEMVS